MQRLAVVSSRIIINPNSLMDNEGKCKGLPGKPALRFTVTADGATRVVTLSDMPLPSQDDVIERARQRQRHTDMSTVLASLKSERLKASSLTSMTLEGVESATTSLWVRIISARDLPKADVLGSSDPYVEVNFADQLHLIRGTDFRTKTIKGSLHPRWHDSRVFDVVPGAHDIVFRVFDADLITKDELLGVCSIPMANIPPFDESSMMSSKPIWLPLLDDKGMPAGELRVHVMTIRETHYSVKLLEASLAHAMHTVYTERIIAKLEEEIAKSRNSSSKISDDGSDVDLTRVKGKHLVVEVR